MRIDTIKEEKYMGVSKNQRVGVFVDVQNMYYSAKNKYSSKVDFEKLLNKAVRGHTLVRAIAYMVQTDDIDQSKFRDILRKQGYETKIKPLRKRPDGTAKGDWDMGIAIDAISMSNRLDAVSLISGDGDFVDLVEMLKSRGVRVDVYSFPTSTADELKEAATDYHKLNDDYLL